jgi:hypothetical protein
MSKSIILFLAVGLIAYLLGPFFPFWVLMILIGVFSFFVGERPMRSFFAAGVAMGLVWLGLSLWISINSASALPDQMAELMGLKKSNLLWVATALVGFLIAGFSAMTGGFFRRFFKRKVDGYYRG